nr:tRNA modification GTPase MnmE [Ipomoea batatas]
MIQRGWPEPLELDLPTPFAKRRDGTLLAVDLHCRWWPLHEGDERESVGRGWNERETDERVWGSGTLNPSNPPVTNSSTIAAIVTSLGGPLAAIGIVRLSGRKQQKQMYDEQQQKQKDWASIGSGVRSQQFISCMIVLINAIKIVGK